MSKLGSAASSALAALLASASFFNCVMRSASACSSNCLTRCSSIFSSLRLSARSRAACVCVLRSSSATRLDSDLNPSSDILLPIL